MPMNKCIAINDYVNESNTAETKMLHSLHLDLKSHILEKLNRNETCNRVHSYHNEKSDLIPLGQRNEDYRMDRMNLNRKT